MRESIGAAELARSLVTSPPARLPTISGMQVMREIEQNLLLGRLLDRDGPRLGLAQNLVHQLGGGGMSSAAWQSDGKTLNATLKNLRRTDCNRSYGTACVPIAVVVGRVAASVIAKASPLARQA
jgi:hypothetical protein